MKTKHTGTMTRRHFGQLAAAAAAGLTLPRWAHAVLPASTHRLAFASVTGPNGGGVIHALRVINDVTETLSMTSNAAAGRLLLHPTLPVLYALHDVALWEHLPRGAVSAYRFNTGNGTLTLLNTQPLSLAASHPQDGTVFLNGTALFLKTNAGVYNVLPLVSDGSLRPVSAIRKVVGDVPIVLLLCNDGETLLELFGTDDHSYRLVQDEGGAQLQEVAFDRAWMPRRKTFKETRDATLLTARLADSVPGFRSAVVIEA